MKWLGETLLVMRKGNLINWSYTRSPSPIDKTLMLNFKKKAASPLSHNERTWKSSQSLRHIHRVVITVQSARAQISSLGLSTPICDFLTYLKMPYVYCIILRIKVMTFCQLPPLFMWCGRMEERYARKCDAFTDDSTAHLKMKGTRVAFYQGRRNSIGSISVLSSGSS